MGGSHGFYLQRWELVTCLIRTYLLPILWELSNVAFAVLLQHREMWGKRPKWDLTVACQHFKDPKSTEPLASPGISSCRTACEIYSRSFVSLWRPGMLPPVDENTMANPYPGLRFMLHALRLRVEQIRQWQDCPCSSEKTLRRLGLWAKL